MKQILRGRVSPFGRFIFLLRFVLTCTRCLQPEPLSNTMTEPALIPETSELGSYLIWRCEEGYVMSGAAEAVIRVCSINGTWIGDIPQCNVITCKRPPIPAYGSVASQTDTVRADENITYACHSNYSIVGDAMNRCLRDGSWERRPPVCQRNCAQPYYRRHSNHSCYRRSDSGRWDVTLCSEPDELLATVKDTETQDFLSGFLQELTDEQDTWIGAREGLDWKWQNSDEYILTLFWKNAFPDAEPRSCIALEYNNGDDTFSWHGLDCFQGNAVICQHDKICHTAGLNSSNTTTEYRGQCFSFWTESMNWHDGSTFCSGIGGYLAEIFDESTNDFLIQKVTFLRSVDFTPKDIAWWIGGFDDDEDEQRSWFWADNTRMIYESWGRNQPNKNNHQCVRMRPTSHNWDDGMCRKEESALCQLGIPACGDPGDPMNGVRRPNDRTTFAVTATVDFSCDPGYTLLGSRFAGCEQNETWNHEPPFCKAITCVGEFPQVSNAPNVTLLSNEYRGVAIYNCIDGYIPDSSPASFCKADKIWSTPKFRCLPIPACHSNPCQNEGTCEELINGHYNCHCPDNLAGTTCEIAATSGPGSEATHREVPTIKGLTTTPGYSDEIPIAAIVSGTMVPLAVIVFAVACILLLQRRNKSIPPERSENELDEYETIGNYVESIVKARPTHDRDGLSTDATINDSHHMKLGEEQAYNSANANNEEYELVGPTSHIADLEEHNYYQSVDHLNEKQNAMSERNAGNNDYLDIYSDQADRCIADNMQQKCEWPKDSDDMYDVLQEKSTDNGKYESPTDTVTRSDLHVGDTSKTTTDGSRVQYQFASKEEKCKRVKYEPYTPTPPDTVYQTLQLTDSPNQTEEQSRESMSHYYAQISDDGARINAHEEGGGVRGSRSDASLSSTTAPRNGPSLIPENKDEIKYVNADYHSQPDMIENELYKGLEDM